ncbi:hypothetical protein H0X48_01750 [Candidatus Dependentiae bacterium]|nr:hypothetical protein [Candidatus Dependentiae bacterium]
MNILSFIETISRSPEILSGISVCFFKLTSLSPLYVAEITRFLKSQPFLCVNPLDLDTVPLEQAQAQLQMSFLGTKHFYVLKNIQALEIATKKKWLSFIKNYKGPHTIALFDATADFVASSDCLVIDIPEKVTLEEYRRLVAVLYPKDHVASIAETVVKLFEKQTTIVVDTACILIAYQNMLGTSADQFLQQIITKVIPADKSFFTLSGLLFARQRKDFFSSLVNFKDYPDEFWTVFWSDQLWQATLFVAKAQETSVQEAKQLGFKLPFSFINKDWRLYTPELLAQAHQFLYSLDYRLKNGGGDYGLELWYHKFFLGKF